MRLINCATGKKNPGIALVVVLAVFLLTACASKMPFTTSAIVPAAEGYVTVKKNDNKNYNVELSVKRLAEAERLTPSMNTYVVWMRTENNPDRNIGQLSTSSSMFSKILKSSLETSSPDKPKGFFITAEHDGNTKVPGSMIVLDTKK